MKTLILLLLMTGICLADEPEVIDYGNWLNESKYLDFYIPEHEEENKIPRIKYKSESEIVMWDGKTSMIFKDVKQEEGQTYRITCPDGWYLKGEIWNRNIKGTQTPIQTDAELKCVKEN